MKIKYFIKKVVLSIFLFTFTKELSCDKEPEIDKFFARLIKPYI